MANRISGAHPKKRGFVVDRPPSRAAVAVVATWFTFVSTLPRQIGPSIPENVIAGLLAVPLVLIGFVAVSRARPLPRATTAQRVERTTVSAIAGGVLGFGILGFGRLLVSIDPSVARIAAGTEDWVELVVLAVEAAPFEEVIFRLVGLSVIAWAIGRVERYREKAFPIALVVSAVLFGLAHLPSISLAGFGLMLANTVAGLALGWLFWRWGLPHAILAHFTAGLVVQGLGPSILS